MKASDVFQKAHNLNLPITRWRLQDGNAYCYVGWLMREAGMSVSGLWPTPKEEQALARFYGLPVPPHGDAEHTADCYFDYLARASSWLDAAATFREYES